MISHPTSFEASLSLLTYAIGCIEQYKPETKDQVDRLYWTVARADRAAVKHAQETKDERTW